MLLIPKQSTLWFKDYKWNLLVILCSKYIQILVIMKCFAVLSRNIYFLFFFHVYILSLIMTSSCMYSGMDLDHSYFSFSVYQFVNFLCFKCSTCAHLHTHKKWMLWNCKKWWVWIYLGYSTTGQCRKSFKTTWIRKSDPTKCNRTSYYFQWWQPWGEWTLITYIQM